MSQQDVEVLREGLAAINTGEIERILQFVAPEFVAIVPQELSAEPDTYRGHEGIRRYFETFQEAMDEIRFEAERFWDVGDDRVVVSLRLTARGKQTAIPVEQRAALVWRIAGHQAIEVRAFASLQEALASAGLQEEAPAAGSW